jgi:hypothetical protein
MSWKYIRDELPAYNKEVIWCNPYSGIMVISAINGDWDGDLSDEYFEYWQELPQLPEIKDDTIA